MLSQERLKEILKYNSELGEFKWLTSSANCISIGDKAGYLDKSTGYQVIKINGKRYYAHHLVWLYTYGKIPDVKSKVIMYIDSNKSNFKLVNLRLCERSIRKINKEITHEKLKEILKYDSNTGLFTHLEKHSVYTKENIGTIAGGLDKEGYTIINTLYGNYKAHRLAWLYVYGEFPSGVIDHINGVRNDNRITNLRDVSSKVNSRNTKRHITNKSGFTGIRSSVKTVNGKIYRYQTAYWRGVDGKGYEKSFREDEYGIDVARELAIKLRQKMIIELNELGAGYTTNHGQ